MGSGTSPPCDRWVPGNISITDRPGRDWLGPPPSVVVPPSDHLLGGPDRWEDSKDPWFADNMVAVAACNCGQPGCEAVLMKVTASSGTFRRDGPFHRVGPFTFDRTKYEVALRSIGHA
jgi:hypothetical protein